MSNLEKMRTQVKQLELELETFDYNNSLIRSSNGIPERLSSDYLEWQKRVEKLVEEASKEFPDVKIYQLFNQAKGALNPRIDFLDSQKFENGMTMMSKVLDMIKQNAVIENIHSYSNQPVKTIEDVQIAEDTKTTKIFISYYSEQTLAQIQTVFRLLSKLKTEVELDPSCLTIREQSISLDALPERGNDIKQCSGAIICLPPTESLKNSNNFVYFDLGACMSLFPKKILLIHEGQDLPRTFQEKLELFHFLGNLNLENGMELAQEILQIFS